MLSRASNHHNAAGRIGKRHRVPTEGLRRQRHARGVKHLQPEHRLYAAVDGGLREDDERGVAHELDHPATGALHGAADVLVELVEDLG